MPPQRQNLLPDLTVRNSIERTTAQAVIMCGHSDTCNMQETVNWVGASQGAPGSLLTGLSTPPSSPPI
ncbi:hypothetical protein DVP82_08435 [Yersinia enterocolitica]|nr:hypothetical protein [Yersinia enterocolitica]EKN5909191.1 hypothetical protein [Yersinia enterocolitica]EKN5921782.1 hypothetical protein [Yersinia enterocolitica]EKN5941002.1 hypothetical protein [Yersinia enterocolitica]EKN6016928.1 hypothetical protein [Yersinia enterocolitica]